MRRHGYSGRQRFLLTLCTAAPTIARAMNAALPESVDAWRMVQARRIFQGRLPLAGFKRLRDSLAAHSGEVTYELEFGKDEIGVAHLRVRADAILPLTCQRSLEVFGLPVHVDAKLGLIAREADEAALPSDYEPLLTADGQISPAEVIEDELILALPVVPLKPGAEDASRVWGDTNEMQDDAEENPFAALKKMKVAKK
jgi:uncharacterized protein